MIIVKIHAGIGNQMFQYATGLRLARYRKTQLKLDITSFSQMAEIDTPRHYDLDQYQISSPIAGPTDLARVLPIDFQATLLFRLKRRLDFDKRLRPLGEHSKAFYDIVLRARDNTYLIGWWQNERYFSDIRPTLLRELTPKKLSPYTKNILSQIKNSQAISLHVRRGDYITNKYANKEHGVAPLAYYKAAAEKLKKKTREPRFFVFSDDSAWCRKNLNLGTDTVFVEGRGRGASEDIYLIQHCRHNITANSSFSWWGAWLNENADKIVIAPKHWFQNKQADQETEIVPESWIRL